MRMNDTRMDTKARSANVNFLVEFPLKPQPLLGQPTKNNTINVYCTEPIL